MACGCRKSVRAPQGEASAYPDTMRHGRFPYEVRGSDYAARVVHGLGNLFAPLTRHDANSNQSESGVPIPDSQFVALHRNAPSLVRQMAPLVPVKRYNNVIGGFIARSARNQTLVFDPKYAGILPISLQPKVDKAEPYTLPVKTA